MIENIIFIKNIKFLGKFLKKIKSILIIDFF